MSDLPLCSQDYEIPPERVSFNFLAKCNMSCPYCYCPFDNQQGGLDIWKRIIDKIKSWSTVSVTFGGGDPFLYKSFPELLIYAKANPNPLKFIQVDTNGLGLDPRHDQIIQENVDLLGLPLDGSNSEIHGLMRSNFKHFEVVLSLLRRLDVIVPLKVNTVVSELNFNDLERMLNLLAQFKVRIWSLYEYWQLGSNTTSNQNQAHTLSPDKFIEKAHRLKQMCDFAEVEIGSISSRARAYFFVSQTGRSYTINSEDPHQYVELGSIFDKAVLQKWSLHADQHQMSDRLRGRFFEK